MYVSDYINSALLEYKEWLVKWKQRTKQYETMNMLNTQKKQNILNA